MRYPLDRSARELLDRLPWIAAVLRGSEPHVEYSNSHFQRLFGRTDADIEATVARSPAPLGSLRDRILRALESGTPLSLHRVPIAPLPDDFPATATARRLDIRLHPLQTSAKNNAGLLVAVDVTHRVGAAHRLAGRERLGRRLLHAVGSTSWQSDPSGRRVRDLDSGRPLAPIGGDGDPNAAATQSAWAAALQDRSTFTFVHSVTRDDGVHSLLTRAIPDLNARGEIERWLGIDIDVTALMRSAHAYAPEDAGGMDLALRVRALRGFSHDVRNVLHAADGYVQLMEDEHYGPLTGEQRESLHRVRGLFGNAMALITSMLETERARRSMTLVARVPTEMNALVRECVDGHRAQAEIRKLFISVQSDLPELWTHTDPARVRQILDNLVSNALKFTRAGAIAIDLQLQEKPAPGARPSILIRVSDTGPGIPIVEQEGIFEEFTRAGTEKVAGQGIGLAMSRILAHLVGGEITVRSEPGSGSSFTLWLPYDRVSGSRESFGTSSQTESDSESPVRLA